MSENHRGPEVPEVRAPVVECRDGLARITLEELVITHLAKGGILLNAWSTRIRVVAVLGEKWSFAHRQVDKQPTKRCKKNDHKSAVTMLKKDDWQEREFVTDECHDRPGKPEKRSGQELGQNSFERQSLDARQLGCVFQDMTPPKFVLRKSTDMPKPIQRVKCTKVIARHTKIRDLNPSVGNICPGEPHERGPNAPKLEDRSQDRVGRARCPRSSVEAGKNVLKLKEHERAALFSPENLLVSGK